MRILLLIMLLSLTSCASFNPKKPFVKPFTDKTRIVKGDLKMHSKWHPLDVARQIKEQYFLVNPIEIMMICEEMGDSKCDSMYNVETLFMIAHNTEAEMYYKATHKYPKKEDFDEVNR